MTAVTKPELAQQCDTMGCDRPAPHTVTAAKVAAQREISRRCCRCAGLTAWQRLNGGYAVMVEPIAVSMHASVRQWLPPLA